MAKEETLQAIEKELDEMERNKPQNGFRRGHLKETFEALAEKYDVTFFIVRNKYYNEIKDKYEITPSLSAQSTQNVQQKTAIVQESNYPEDMSFYFPEKPVRPPYKYGEVLKVRVQNLVPYGVFVETLDGYMYRGLLHISEVKEGYITDLDEYFEPGDIIEVKVKRVNPDGRMELSTKGMKIPKKIKTEEDTEMVTKSNPPINSLAEKLESMKDKIQEVVVPTVTEKEKAASVQKVQTTQTSAAQTAVIQKPILSSEEPEIKDFSVEEEIPEAKEVIRFLNGIVGVISPKGKNMLKSLIETHGVFKFTVAMMQVEKEFENDLSFYLMREIEEKLSEGL